MTSKHQIVTFSDALENSPNNRHLLLGNGFSIACRPDTFRYDKLYQRADFSSVSAFAQGSFEALGTHDFEQVIQALKLSAQISNQYQVDPKTIDLIKKDAEALKEILVETISNNHPDSPTEITEEEYDNCHAFLSHFPTIYTLNYDLLLYWTLMHSKEKGRKVDDGFRAPSEDGWNQEPPDYVTWEPWHSYKSNVKFLHGALHIFDEKILVKKYTWSRTGVRLITQIREALRKDMFPIFVAEGTSNEKLERIRHNDFLNRAYRGFSEISGCLFIYGHSLASNDEHILERIEQGKLSQLFVGIYGDPSSDGNQAVISRALKMPTNRRNKNRDLEINFFDSSTANVWRT